VRAVIPDLIEIGVDILNPVQVSATGMDSAELKKEYADDITFWGGGVDTQQVLGKGSPEDVRNEVKRRIEDLAPDGGFVFATVHNILEPSGLRHSLPVVLLRLGLLVPLALALNAVVTRGFLGLGEGSEAALFTLLILPPPFIIPLYIRPDLPDEEKEYINNTLTLHTLASIGIYLIYFTLVS
jgi:hypothetical protein